MPRRNTADVSISGVQLRALAGFLDVIGAGRAGRSEDASHRVVVHIQRGGDLVDLHPLRVERQDCLILRVRNTTSARSA
jgi:hypothetical protein